MDFEKEYSQAIAGFTRLLADRPRRVYLAPGDSAGEMTKRIRSYAKTEHINIPAIHILSHEESWKLYGGLQGGGPDARAIVKPYLEGKRPQKLYFLEDYYWGGDKIREIGEKMMVCHAIVAYFLVMVGSNKENLLPLPNTEVYTHNHDLAYTLFQTYNRWKY